MEGVVVCGKSRRNTLVCIYGWDFSPLTPWFDVYLDVQNKHDQCIFLGDNANKRYLIFHLWRAKQTQKIYLRPFSLIGKPQIFYPMLFSTLTNHFLGFYSYLGVHEQAWPNPSKLSLNFFSWVSICTQQNNHPSNSLVHIPDKRVL